MVSRGVEDQMHEDLLQNYLAARDQVITDEITTLSQDDFIAGLRSAPDWAIGPFQRDQSLTFTKSEQLADPTGIGWTSSSIFNPSIIEEDGFLHLFYRASVKKESLGSRIGHAIYVAGSGWRKVNDSPILYPTRANELLSVEDPKVYRIAPGNFVLFYNSAWRATPAQVEEYKKPFGDLACDINFAFSSDLITWEKAGLVVPYEVSRLWAKGAVIPRDEYGNAVRINNEYWMFLSEGCGGQQFIGKSRDMRGWHFEPITYLELPSAMGTHIYEVATAIVSGENLILDFMYADHEGRHSGAQARYELSNPTVAREIAFGATLAWGGLIKYRGDWMFAQGWDAPNGKEEIYFYRRSQSELVE